MNFKARGLGGKPQQVSQPASQQLAQTHVDRVARLELTDGEVWPRADLLTGHAETRVVAQQLDQFTAESRAVSRIIVERQKQQGKAMIANADQIKAVQS